MIQEIVVFIFGSIVGSFLNVCIHRMPLGKSVAWPRSHCPKCEKRIAWYDNIPFISYLLLKGRCRYCKTRISVRYIIVELLTAIMFVVFFRRFGLSYDFIFYSVFTSNLIIATFVDIKHRIIPDEVSLGGIIIGFLLSAIKGFGLKPLSFIFHPAFSSLMGIIVGAGIIYLTRLLFDTVYFKLLKKPPVEGETQSLGDGDIKLLAMIGAFLGWQRAIATFFIAPFLGVSIGLINLLVKKGHIIPYGPFLSLASLVSLFWLDKITRLLFIR